MVLRALAGWQSPMPLSALARHHKTSYVQRQDPWLLDISSQLTREKKAPGWQQQPSANTKRRKPHRATLKAGLRDEPPQLAPALVTVFNRVTLRL